MPFHGRNKIRPMINVTTGKKTFNWLFNTVAAITFMNANSFRESFGHSKPKLLKKSAGCIAPNGSQMSSQGIFEIEMTILGRKFLHPVTVVEDINDNILGIDFMHTHKLNYDSTSKQITFAHMLTNALYSVKEVTILALSSMMVTTKFKALNVKVLNPLQQYMPSSILKSQGCLLGLHWTITKTAKLSLTTVHHLTLCYHRTKYLECLNLNLNSVCH